MYIVRFQYYQHEHNKPMSCQATAAMISTMLYYRRFFPFYCYNIVGGLDEEGVCILITKALRKHRFQVTRLLIFFQAKERFTATTRSGPTNANSSRQLAPHRLSCSRCWTIR